MYAHVYPILRLPRRFGVFDYHIPDNLDIRVGDVVSIPFNNRSVQALVARVDATTNVMNELREITSIIWRSAYSSDDIARVENIAARIVQSPCTILYHALGEITNTTDMPALHPPRQSAQHVSRDAAEVITRASELLKTTNAVTLQLAPEHALSMTGLVCERSQQQTLVIVPRERDADTTVQSVNLGKKTAVLHGRTKPKERERIIRAWRMGTVRVLVGTRQAALLAAEAIGHVVVLSSGTEDHFNDRKNPRLDSRLLAEAQALQHRAKLILCDALPRCEELGAFPVVFQPNPAQCSVVNLRQPEEQTDYPLLTESLVLAAKSALQSGKNLLLFYNRKGVARRAQCRSCGEIPVCNVCQAVPSVTDDRTLRCIRCGNTGDIPAHCAACEHGKVGLKGIGNAHIERDLANLFPGVRIARIEKGHAKDLDARILLVTEYYFTAIWRPFMTKRFGLVADLSLDLSFTPDDFRGAENAARKLHRLSAIAKQQGAPCIIQTWLPDIVEPMQSAEMFLTNEFHIRSTYGLPPTAARISVRHTDAEVMTQLTGHAFITVPELLGCQGRVPIMKLDTALSNLQTLPDTSVISIDCTYESHRPPLPRSKAS